MRRRSEGYVVCQYDSVWKTRYGNASRVGYLFYGTLAQLVEHLTEDQGVPCSTHGGTTNPIIYTIELRNTYYIEYRRGLSGVTRNF